MSVKSLNEVIQVNSGFRTSINLYLSLNKTEKVLSYIPTKSSVLLMDDYIKSVLENKENATLLIGPYGKGKSHLLLVFLAVLSLERNKKNQKVIDELVAKIAGVEEIGERAAADIESAWKKGRFLPVIINANKSDLDQAILAAVSEALKRDGLEDLAPDTYFSSAVERIEEWKKDYPDTYKTFAKELKKQSTSIDELKADLKQFSKAALDTFETIYPRVTAGSTFNPLATADVLPLLKNISDRLKEDYGYSGIYIVFDEFSKFIEGLDGINAGLTMKLVQDICELAADSSGSEIHFTMVAHKSIKEYGKYLSTDIINAFTGIEGRIVERYFVTSSNNNYELIKNAIIKDEKKLPSIPGYKDIFSDGRRDQYFRLPAFTSNFEEADFTNIIFKGCYPLNPIAAYLLLNISEKVAQNERTLFTFISNDEPNSMARYIAEHETGDDWVIGADLIYDYFSGLFKKDVTNELVHNTWLAAEYALNKCDTEDERKLVKTLALIIIVNKNEEMPATESFLLLAANLLEGSEVIQKLEEQKVIYKKSSIQAYVFKTRAGSELKSEIKRQREIKGDKCDFSGVMQQITGEYFVIPRRYNTEMSMTRYFEHRYMDVEAFLSIDDKGALFDSSKQQDGLVLSLYSFKRFSVDSIEEHFKDLDCKNLVVVVPAKTLKAAKALIDFEILQSIKENNVFINNNEVLEREIPLLEEDIVKECTDELSAVYDQGAKVLYLSDGELQIGGSSEVENAVNVSCREVFKETPLINNEIINRKYITTGQTKKARLNIIEAILKGEDDEAFYGGTNQEATLYRSLLVNTKKDGKYDDRLREILDLISDFIDSCSDEKVSFSGLISELENPPYGMRGGVLPIYLAKVFSDRREDLIVYFSEGEVSLSPEIVVNICENPRDYSLYVSKENLQKEHYIDKLNTLFSVKEGRGLSDNRIKNIIICMQRWFRALPQVSRNLAGVDDLNEKENIKDGMQTLRDMLQREIINPYEMLFVDLPDSFGSKDLEKSYRTLEKCKKEFDGYFNWTIQRAVSGIYSAFDKAGKQDLYHVLKEWYEKQSTISKQGLQSGDVTNFMSCIEHLDSFSDEEVAQKVVKAVTNVYIENWSDNACEDFVEQMTKIKSETESLQDSKTEGQCLLSFTGKDGRTIEKYYEPTDEKTGDVLRNMLEDTLDSFEDISVNDRVAILLEMVEKVIG